LRTVIDPEGVIAYGSSAGAILWFPLVYGDYSLEDRPNFFINRVGMTDATQFNSGLLNAYLGTNTPSLALKQAMSAVHILNNTTTEAVPTYSLYAGAAGVPPVPNPHNTYFGVALHTVLDAEGATNALYVQDPNDPNTNYTPEMIMEQIERVI
ncbi:MAG: hypothetical protein AABY11_03150, partial [archaeon]